MLTACGSSDDNSDTSAASAASTGIGVSVKAQAGCIGVTLSQDFVIKGNRLYIFTATAASDKFENMKGEFKAFLDSVKF